jgi:hypothetical protein
MTKEFKKIDYGDPPEQIIRLSRKQIEQMYQMIEHFKEVDDFQLRITHTTGIGPSVHFTFDLDLTDVTKW